MHWKGRKGDRVKCRSSVSGTYDKMEEHIQGKAPIELNLRKKKEKRYISHNNKTMRSSISQKQS